eukprot:8191624-Pyramimonas_sp.AAC.1
MPVASAGMPVASAGMPVASAPTRASFAPPSDHFRANTFAEECRGGCDREYVPFGVRLACEK